MLAVRAGRVDRLALLFERHHAGLYRYFVRLSGDRSRSEDFVQEVFFRMLKYRHTFRGDGPFVVWMFQLARNVYFDHRKKWGRERTVASDSPEDTAATPSDQLQRQEDLAILEAALARLSDEKRELLILSRYQGLKYEEIAALMGLTVGAVKVRVHRILKELRAQYEKLSQGALV